MAIVSFDALAAIVGLALAAQTSQVATGLAQLAWLYTLAAVLVVAASVAGYLYLRSRLFGRLETLTIAARGVKDGRYRIHLDHVSNDEIGQLTEVINYICEQLSSDYLKLSKHEEQAHPTGRVQEIEEQNKALEDAKTAMLNILDDLSEEKNRTEEEKAKDEILLESIGEGLIATDEYGNITNCNQAASELLDYEPSELVGKWFPKAITVTDEYGKEMPIGERPINQALATGKVVSATAMYLRKDRTAFPVFMTVSPVVIDGRPIGAVEVFRDISKERELERAKDEFVSLASHQLRTPASGVKAFTSMLMDGYAGKMTKKQQEFLQKVYDSNERQLRIVDDMLNVARADAGHLTLDKQKTDLTALLNKIATEQGAVAAGRQQTLKLEAPKQAITAEVDVEKLRMAIDNLVSNAIKYTHDGGQITIKLEKLKDKINISVTDSGVGISKQDFKRLFQKFSRIDNELSAQVGGSGLGLYLVNTIIEMHKGKIEVDSAIGKGSTFTVSLPTKAL